MDDDSRYFAVSASSKNTMDLYIDIEEEIDDDDDLMPEYVCPFCFEDFDLVGFCCHIDNGHPIEAKSGICRICAKRVGSNLAVHIITQHGVILKALYKKKLCNGGSYSTLSSLRKNAEDAEDEYEESFVDESSCFVSSSNMTADPLLSSFIYNRPPVDEAENLQSSLATEAKTAEKRSDDNKFKRDIHQSPLSNKDQEEASRKSEFVQGLLFSTILDDDL